MLRTTSLSNQNLCTTWNVPAGPRTVTTERTAFFTGLNLQPIVKYASAFS